jgi:hypothetical protein
MAIRSIEWLGMYESSKLIVKSGWMRDEALRLYKVPSEKVNVIPPNSTGWMKNILTVYEDVAEKSHFGNS